MLALVALLLTSQPTGAAPTVARAPSIADLVCFLSTRETFERLTSENVPVALKAIGEFAESGRTEFSVSYDLKFPANPLLKSGFIVFVGGPAPSKYRFQQMVVEVGGQPKLAEAAKTAAKKKLGRVKWRNDGAWGWSLKDDWAFSVGPTSAEARAKGHDAVISIGIQGGEED